MTPYNLEERTAQQLFDAYYRFQAQVAQWTDPEYVIYSLAEEAHEFQAATRTTKEQFRGDAPKDTDEAVKKELGDVFFFWMANCKHFGLDPFDVIKGNMQKLAARLEAGTIKGDGDNR